jgi:ubiquitin carboxyl-terminal hydrolase L5
MDETPIPSHGLIFLFKWRQEVDEREVLDPSDMPELFFSRQIVNNACATQALLSVLLNAEETDLGKEMSDFKSFVAGLDSESRGIAIGNSDQIRVVHNSFARPEPFMSEESKFSTGTEDVYHFIAYVPFRGGVYEIDGLKDGPILIGDTTDSADWLAVAKPAIQARMNRYSASETHFALLSIQQKRTTVLQQELQQVHAMAEGTEGMVDELVERISSLQSRIEDEEVKKERQRQENVRRRHNYIPFAIHLLGALSAKGALVSMVAKAKENPRKKTRNHY